MRKEGVRIYVSGNYTDIHDNQVVNVYTEKEAVKLGENKAVNENPPSRPIPSKEDILNYVMRLHPQYVHPKWADSYLELWKKVLELPEVCDAIYHPGKQRGTNFNRSLTTNILHEMREMNVLTGTNQHMAEALEGTCNESVRKSLGEMPMDRKIRKDIKGMIELVY